MNQWEICHYQFPDIGKHPVVIISPDRVCTGQGEWVNCLLCSSQRAGRPPSASEVLLDAADGLDWETLCKCQYFFEVDKRLLWTMRGNVTPERRRQISAKIIELFGFRL